MLVYQRVMLKMNHIHIPIEAHIHPELLGRRINTSQVIEIDGQLLRLRAKKKVTYPMGGAPVWNRDWLVQISPMSLWFLLVIYRTS